MTMSMLGLGLVLMVIGWCIGNKMLTSVGGLLVLVDILLLIIHRLNL